MNRRTERLDPRARNLLAELERALLDALADSPEAQAVLGRLARAGFTVRVAIECLGPRHEEPGQQPVTTRGEEPAFRIDAQDLAFLRSIGIDPTRRPRRPRRP